MIFARRVPFFCANSRLESFNAIFKSTQMLCACLHYFVLSISNDKDSILFFPNQSQPRSVNCYHLSQSVRVACSAWGMSGFPRKNSRKITAGFSPAVLFSVFFGIRASMLKQLTTISYFNIIGFGQNTKLPMEHPGGLFIFQANRH